jgi:hypothetical protein
MFLFWYDGASWKEHRLSNSVRGVLNIAFGKKGAVWFGTMHGIVRYENGEWTEFTDQLDPGNQYIRSLAIDENDILWAASWMGGAFRYDGREWKRYDETNGLLSNRMSAVTVDHANRKWFATENGYCILDDSSSSSVRDAAPVPLALHGNRPNPFNPSTTISFSIPSSGKISLAVYDITGRKVRTLLSDHMSAGTHSITWDGRDDSGQMVASGIYLSRLIAGKKSATGRMVLLK